MSYSPSSPPVMAGGEEEGRRDETRGMEAGKGREAKVGGVEKNNIEGVKGRKGKKGFENRRKQKLNEVKKTKEERK